MASNYLLRTLEPGDLEACAALLATRHEADRACRPLLPVVQASPEGAGRAIEAALARPGATGVVAVEGSRLVGYLIADTAEHPIHGHYAWVRVPGLATAEDAAASIVADLWTTAAAPVVRAGAQRHHVELPSHRSSWIDQFFGLEFGWRQTYAVRALDPRTTPSPGEPRGVTIERGDAGSAPAVRHLVELASRSLALPPAFDPLPEAFYADSEASTRAFLEEEGTRLHVAHRDGEPIGIVVVAPAGEDAADLVAGPAACELVIAGVAPEERSRGVASALVAEAIRDAVSLGYLAMLCDWRQSNLMASRFWPRFGFRPAVVRLHRHLTAGAVAAAAPL